MKETNDEILIYYTNFKSHPTCVRHDLLSPDIDQIKQGEDYKLFTDASINPQFPGAGYGMVVLGHNGNMIAAMEMFDNLCFTPLAAEIQEIVHDLRLLQ